MTSNARNTDRLNLTQSHATAAETAACRQLDSMPAASVTAQLWTLLWKQLAVNWRRRLWLKTLIQTGFFCGLTMFLADAGLDSKSQIMIFGVLMVLATQSMPQSVVEDVAKEKEDKMQEVMQIYGISRSTYWTGHYIFYICGFAPALAALISCLLCGLTDLFGERSLETGFLVWLFLWLHLATLGALAFGVTIQSKDFESAVSLLSIFQVGGLLLTTILFEHAIEPLTDAPQNSSLSQAGPTAGSLILTVLFGVCLPYMPLTFFISTTTAATRLANADSPAFFAVTFNELLVSPRQFPLLYQYLLLLFTNVGWFSLAFFLDRRAHQSSEAGCAVAGLANALGDPAGDEEAGRARSRDDSCLLVLDKLRKEFTVRTPESSAADDIDAGFGSVSCSRWWRRNVFDTRVKVALDDVSFGVRPGEIFGLLGHNGAGKTTLINILTGMTPAMSGDAVVCGNSIHNDMASVRSLTSVCPQDNPIWAEFTVREHLKFFAVCRSVPETKLGEEVERYCTALGLGEKLDYPCGKLSGGQKRRLWVATSLLGNCKLLLMDEPTSGMDTQARRDFWVLLKEITSKEGRSVMFSTHYLEEADLLADRKVVLAGGKVKALGTSKELKRNFGTGYWVNFALSATADETSEVMKSGILAFVAEHLSARAGNAVTASTLRQSLLVKNTHASNERFFAVCVPWAYQDTLGFLLDDIEGNLTTLGVEHHSVEMTSLEEVFMKIGEQSSDVGHGIGQRTVVDAYRQRSFLRSHQIMAMLTMRWRLYLQLPAALHLMTFIIMFIIWIFLVLGWPGFSTFGSFMTQASEDFETMLQECKGDKKVDDKSCYLELYADFAPGRVVSIGRFGNLVCMPLFLHAFRIMMTQLKDRVQSRRRLAELHGLRAVNYLLGGFLFSTAEFTLYYMVIGVLIATYCLPFSDITAETGDGGASVGVLLGLVVPLSAMGSVLASYSFSRLLSREEQLGLVLFPFTLAVIVTFIYVGIKQSEAISHMWIIQDASPTQQAQTNLTGQHERLKELYDWNLLEFFLCMLLPYYQLAGVAKTMMHYVLRERLLKDDAFFHFLVGARGGPYVVPGYGDDAVGANVLPPHIRLLPAPSFLDLLSFRENTAFYGTVASIFFWGLVQAFVLERVGWDSAFGRSVLRLCCCAGADTKKKLVYAQHTPLKSGEGPPEDARGQQFSNDEAVLWEERRVLGDKLTDGASSEDVCQLVDLRHRFKDISSKNRDGHFWALNGVTLGIKRGECFGLLGPNGAGKTTALSLMVGDPALGAPTCGGVTYRTDTIIEPYNDQNPFEFAELYQIVGVTPQFDCLWDHITGRQHLRFFAQISGTYWPPPGVDGSGQQAGGAGPGLDSDDEHLQPVMEAAAGGGNAADSLKRIPLCDWGEQRVARFLTEVGLLGDDADQIAGKYSGGMKRKLSLALNLITCPDVVFLDEMTCGVDVAAQRVLWTKILQRAPQQTMIMTTHSMVEADALCDRIGILVNGAMRCVGTGMGMKGKYGNGYQLDLLLNLDRAETPHGIVTTNMRDDAPNSGLVRTGSTRQLVQAELDARAAGIIESLAAYGVAPRESLHVLEAIKVSGSLAKIIIGLVQRSVDDMEHSPNATVTTSGAESASGRGAASVKLGHVFRWCADRASLGIVEDYSLGEPTLEQVFLKFAKQQEASDQEQEMSS